ncbi:MAG TPA: rhodanese-like domain-containing protein [archaeon]|nr:rhodanese-like domain-containing protein [archaeon]
MLGFGKKAAPGSISPAEAKARIDEFKPFTIVDIRARAEYEKEHVAEAICVPFAEFAAEVPRTLKKDEENILYDSDDGLAQQAAAALSKQGFGNVRVLEGGLAAWKAAGFPVKQGFF